MLGAILAVLVTAMAVPVAAQGLSGDLAARQLFPTRGSDLAVSSSLSEQERQVLSCRYGFGDDVNLSAIEVHIHRLRKKLENSGVSIATLRGLGYLLRLDRP